MGRRVAFILCLATILGVIAWWAFRPLPDPIYEGKRLSVWLDNYIDITWMIRHGQVAHAVEQPPSFMSNMLGNGSQETDEAVRQAGANAVPLLLHLIRKRDFPFESKLIPLLQKKRLFQRFQPRPAAYYWYEAEHAFRALGPNGKDAVPVLLRMVNDKATPVACRLAAFDALGAIHSQAELAMPVLEKLLKDSDSQVTCAAAEALGSYGTAARPAMPALVEAANCDDLNLRVAAKAALISIDPSWRWKK